MNKKQKRYRVVTQHYVGEFDGVETYVHKYVCVWPDNASEWGARYELSPKSEEALKFGRDTALEIAHAIRIRNGMRAMVEEA